jgi:hypothetical protein
MKTAAETIFVGKQRLYNRRFLQMCSHYLVDPVASPARRHRAWRRGKLRTRSGSSANDSSCRVCGDALGPPDAGEGSMTDAGTNPPARDSSSVEVACF